MSRFAGGRPRNESCGPHGPSKDKYPSFEVSYCKSFSAFRGVNAWKAMVSEEIRDDVG